MNTNSVTAEILTDYAQQLIKIKARQLARRQDMRPSDEEDLRQELTLRLLERARRYDPARASLNTFAERVVSSLAATLVREHHRRKSVAARSVISTETECNCGEDGLTPLRQLLSEADLQRRTGNAPCDPLEALERDDALRVALAGLPPELREVCRRLMRANATEAARELCLPRHRMRKAIDALRTHFRAAGFN